MQFVSYDAGTASVEFKESGVEFALDPGEYKSPTTMVNAWSIVLLREKCESGTVIDIKLEAESEEEGFGSDTVATATVSNKRDGYVCIGLDPARAD